jgi:hypothetical protein
MAMVLTDAKNPAMLGHSFDFLVACRADPKAPGELARATDVG